MVSMAALIVLFALISTMQIAFAEDLNNSVKDCMSILKHAG